MKKLFIETNEFTARVNAFLSDEDYAELHKLLIRQPDLGKVMPGYGGMRKIRFSDPRRGKGKRGGIRIIYIHVPQTDWIFLVDIYDKSERDDLSPIEKKYFSALAKRCKSEGKTSKRRRK